jgi:hypothetical protein
MAKRKQKQRRAGSISQSCRQSYSTSISTNYQVTETIRGHSGPPEPALSLIWKVAKQHLQNATAQLSE